MKRSSVIVKTIRASAVLLLAGPLAVASASAQGWEDTQRPVEDDRYGTDPYGYGNVSSDHPAQGYLDHEGFGAYLGLGFTVDPGTFLIDFTLPYSLGSGTSVGPRVQLGLDNDYTLVAPTVVFEYAHDLSDQIDGAVGRIRPLLHTGLGFAWIEKDGRRRGSDSDIGFLVNVGTGFEYPLSDQFGLASVIDFDIFPRDTLDRNLIFTWQVIQMRVKF